MKKTLALVLSIALALGMMAGCTSGDGDVVMETIGEGVPTEGRPVFYEFFTQG